MTTCMPVEADPSTEKILSDRDQNVIVQPTKTKKQTKIRTQDIIMVSRNEIDFGSCLPGSIHQSEILLTMPYSLDPLILNVKSVCINEQLNNLPEYVFGIRRGSSNEFGDEINVRIQERIPVKLAVGVKIPSIPIGRVEGVIIVEIVGLKLQPLLVYLNLTVRIPQLQCVRELSSESEDRIIKIMMKKKNKKQGKVPFKNLENVKLYAQTQVLGLDKQCLVESNPKTVVVNPKGQFYVNLMVRMSEDMRKEMESVRGTYKIRRILVIKIKDSSVFYHYPVEIAFYDGQKGEGSSES